MYSSSALIFFCFGVFGAELIEFIGSLFSLDLLLLLSLMFESINFLSESSEKDSNGGSACALIVKYVLFLFSELSIIAPGGLIGAFTLVITLEGLMSGSSKRSPNGSSARATIEDGLLDDPNPCCYRFGLRL